MVQKRPLFAAMNAFFAGALAIGCQTPDTSPILIPIRVPASDPSSDTAGDSAAHDPGVDSGGNGFGYENLSFARDGEPLTLNTSERGLFANVLLWEEEVIATWQTAPMDHNKDSQTLFFQRYDRDLNALSDAEIGIDIDSPLVLNGAEVVDLKGDLGDHKLVVLDDRIFIISMVVEELQGVLLEFDMDFNFVAGPLLVGWDKTAGYGDVLSDMAFATDGETLYVQYFYQSDESEPDDWGVVIYAVSTDLEILNRAVVTPPEKTIVTGSGLSLVSEGHMGATQTLLQVFGTNSPHGDDDPIGIHTFSVDTDFQVVPDSRRDIIEDDYDVYWPAGPSWNKDHQIWVVGYTQESDVGVFPDWELGESYIKIFDADWTELRTLPLNDGDPAFRVMTKTDGDDIYVVYDEMDVDATVENSRARLEHFVISEVSWDDAEQSSPDVDEDRSKNTRASTESETTGARLAARDSIAIAPDLNGDGVADVVLGAAGAVVDGQQVGAVYLHVGLVSGDLDLNSAVRIAGESEGDQAGDAVVALGDLNQDGYGDLAIAAPGSDIAAFNAGAVYIVEGPVTADTQLAMGSDPLVGRADHDLAGRDLVGAVDVNGDSIGDLIIGMPGHDGTSYRIGTVYVHHGPITAGTTLDSAAGTWLGGPNDDYAGWELASAGDVNADGLDDILVGLNEAPHYSGAAAVLFGPATGTLKLSSDAGAILLGEAHYDRAAEGVASAGDANGDGFDDVLVGANGEDSGGYNAGAVYVVLGPVTGPYDLATADAKIVGQAEGLRLGSVLSAGDMDGDGVNDVICGLPRWEKRTGAVAVLHGPLEGTYQMTDTHIVLTGDAAGESIGSELAMGDINGDGANDLLVGAPGMARDDGEFGTVLMISGE